MFSTYNLFSAARKKKKEKKLEQWKQFLTQRTYSLKNRHWEERTCCEIEGREQSIVITLVIVCSQLIIITERANF